MLVLVFKGSQNNDQHANISLKGIHLSSVMIKRGTDAIKIDIRLVAATNHDIPREIDEGHFRRDLELLMAQRLQYIISGKKKYK